MNSPLMPRIIITEHRTGDEWNAHANSGIAAILTVLFAVELKQHSLLVGNPKNVMIDQIYVIEDEDSQKHGYAQS